MNPLTWLIFGALAGWVASLIAGNSSRQGCLMNIIVGVIGAFIGGLIVEFVTGRDFIYTFNFRSFIVAVIGAVLLLAITGWSRRK